MAYPRLNVQMKMSSKMIQWENAKILTASKTISVDLSIKNFEWKKNWQTGKEEYQKESFT